MSAFFFGRKLAQQAIEEEELELLALQALGSRNFKVVYGQLRDSLQNLQRNDMAKLPRVEPWLSVRAQRVEDMQALITALDKVDPDRLQAEDVELLKDAVYKKASEAVLLCSQEAMENWRGPGKYTSYAKGAFRESSQLIEQVIRKQFDPDYGRVMGAEAEVDLSRLPFPHHTFENAELAQALRALEKVWKAATKHPTSVEDRYLLEQIVTSWLPESWSLIRGFESYSEQLRQRVEANVLEQLTLITEQVQELLDRNQQSFLSRLEAHTQFLRERGRGQRSSSLNLSRREEPDALPQPSAQKELEAVDEVVFDLEPVPGDLDFEDEEIEHKVSADPAKDKPLTFMKQA